MTLQICCLNKFHINSLVNWYFSRIYRIFIAAHKMIEMCIKLSVVATNYNLFERREIFVLMYGLYIFGSWLLFVHAITYVPYGFQMCHHQNKNERWGVTPQYIDTRLPTHMVCGYGFDSSFCEKRIVFFSWTFKIV